MFLAAIQERSMRALHLLVLIPALLGAVPVSIAQSLNWSTIANNGDEAPGGEVGDQFRSYNPPSLNNAGVVVFRARSATLGSPQAGGDLPA
jgi:hypothetical protein